MTIRKFVVQLSFVFALIIGFSACEKDPITDPINAVENQTTENENNTTGTNDAQTKSQIDCEEFLAMYTEEELAELGIDPETFCDEIEWGGNEDEWDDIDWAMDCDSLVTMYADELEAFGFDLETFCEDIFDGVVVIAIDFEDVTAENCDSLVAMYADELAALGIDLATFCDDWNGEWDGNNDWDDWDDWGNVDWSMNCDSLILMYADQLEEWGIDPATFCDDWNGEWDGNNDWDDWGNVDWSMNCDSLILMYADQLEEWGIDPATFCDGWNGEWDDNDEWDQWGNIDWSMDCDSIVEIYADQLTEWGLDPVTFCDDWSGDWNGDWDYEDAVCCVVQTACGVFVYGDEIEVVAESGQIIVYNADGDVLDSIECEDTTVEVECH